MPTSVVLFAGCVAAAILAPPVPAQVARRRLADLRPARARPQRRSEPHLARSDATSRAGPVWHGFRARVRGRRAFEKLAGPLAAAAAFAMLGGSGPAAIILTAAAGAGGAFAARRWNTTRHRDAPSDPAGVPLAADLFSACLAAGATPADAAHAVADSLSGPLAARFAEVANTLRLGVDPAEAWHPLETDPATAVLARAARRGCVTGAPLAETVAVAAEDLRSARRMRARRIARRAGVSTMAPLGGCFLPAFVLLAVVPLAIALASRLLR